MATARARASRDSQQQEQQEQQDEQQKKPADTGETKEVDKDGDKKSDKGEGEGGAGEATAPGTTLKFGEQAVLPITKDEEEYLVGVTVTAVEKGDEKALRKEFGEQADGITPYYISYEVQNLDGADLSFISAPNLSGTGSDGQSGGAVVSGQLQECKSASAPEDFAKAGATFEGCDLDGSSGPKIVHAKYNGEEKYYDQPVIWKP